jgi:uncharacterized protein (TIGR02266 family)
MSDLSNLFLEYARLDRQRTRGGLSVAELERWSELKRVLNRQFSPGIKSQHVDRRDSVRVPTRLACTFNSLDSFQDALITNLSRGGVFIQTQTPLPVGTPIQLRLQIADTGSELEVAGVVVSNNVGPALGTAAKGMGVRFSEEVPEMLKQIDELYERAGARLKKTGGDPGAPS